MKRIQSILLAISMLLAAPAFFTSCQEDAPEINYTMNVSVINDFSKVVDAINNGFLKNEAAIKKLTDAIDKMNADQQTKLQTIIDVLNSTSTAIETKLAAIEAAMKAQTLTLESKLTLLETAIKNQTIKQEEMADKLVAAIESLQGSMEQKLEAVMKAINSMSTAIETKLALIEAAIKAQTLSLEGKLALLETAIKNQTIKQEEMAGKLIAAIESLQGSMEQKLEAVMKAINSMSTAIETKLALIEAAIKAQTLSLEGKLALLEAAIKALPDYSSQLAAIKTAIENLPDYGDKLSAIEAAIKAIPNYSDKFDAVVAALKTLKAEIQYLGVGQSNIVEAINNTTVAINALVASVNKGKADAAVALSDIIQKLEELKEKIKNGGGGGAVSTMESVDLGLPSGLKWAKCNLGASSPSKSGNYYAWGEIDTKRTYSSDTYKWSNDIGMEKYNETDGKIVLDPEDDVATQKLGKPWHIPTMADFQELIDKCTWFWTTLDGINGYEVKGPNGNSIFLPAAGLRRRRSLMYDVMSVKLWANQLYFSPDYNQIMNIFGTIFDATRWDHQISSADREEGLPVRPVRP